MSSLPTISLASSVIGFISFAISLLTLIRVIWGNLSTLMDAPTQVHYSFANLKQAIFEERSAVHRAARLSARRRESKALDPDSPLYTREHRHSKSASGFGGAEDVYGGASIKIMQETVRKLCKDFKRLEKPFLRPGLGERDRDSRNGRDGAWDSEKRAWEDEVERYRYREEGFAGDYCNMTLGKRLIWLRSKSEVNNLWTSLARLQMRRMAREVTEALG